MFRAGPGVKNFVRERRRERCRERSEASRRKHVFRKQEDGGELSTGKYPLTFRCDIQDPWSWELTLDVFFQTGLKCQILLISEFGRKRRYVAAPSLSMLRARPSWTPGSWLLVTEEATRPLRNLRRQTSPRRWWRWRPSSPRSWSTCRAPTPTTRTSRCQAEKREKTRRKVVTPKYRVIRTKASLIDPRPRQVSRTASAPRPRRRQVQVNCCSPRSRQSLKFKSQILDGQNHYRKQRSATECYPLFTISIFCILVYEKASCHMLWASFCKTAMYETDSNKPTATNKQTTY